MKRLKVLVIAAILGLSVGLLPKAGLADDVRLGVGFFFGLPVPMVTIGDNGPYYQHRYAYGPSYYRGYYHPGYRYHDYRHGGHYGRGDYGHRGYGRGDFGRVGHGRR